MPITSVRIGTLEFPIRFLTPDDLAEDNTLGEFNQSEGIFINPNQSPANMASTVMHECLHAMHYAYRIRKRLNEEGMCEAWEGPMLALIRDNPALVKALSAASKRGVPLKFLPAED